jgi:hypothetical protein
MKELVKKSRSLARKDNIFLSGRPELSFSRAAAFHHLITAVWASRRTHPEPANIKSQEFTRALSCNLLNAHSCFFIDYKLHMPTHNLMHSSNNFISSRLEKFSWLLRCLRNMKPSIKSAAPIIRLLM